MLLIILQQTRYVVKSVFQFRINLPSCKIGKVQVRSGQIGSLLINNEFEILRF